MKIACPSCGAAVEFRFDDSMVRVCDYCRAAVVRSDRGVETLGKFADLVPIESKLQLFAEGQYGSAGLLLIGMAQLRHASGGVWQEWYARLDGGQWGWLSEAQGRLYLTFERRDVTVPSIAQLAPGMTLQLAGMPFTVAERGTATYVAARGEIPYRLAPETKFQFVDLSDGAGGFATIDYNDGSEPPTVYLGAQVTPQGLRLHGGEVAPPQGGAPKQGKALTCPQCHGALELRAPDQSLRIACPYCGSMISLEGDLRVLSRLAHKAKPAIPLGSKGKFLDGELTVIGFLIRSAYVDGSWWPFEEYLLYAPEVGFRWLVCSDWHWSYVQPIQPGAVTVSGTSARYGGVTFPRFLRTTLRVDNVLGELYWRVEVGEQVSAEDYIAPPAMLSSERSANEQAWSLSTYMTLADVDAAFGKSMKLAKPLGVGANQPYPGGVARVTGWLTAAFLAIGITRCATSPDAQKMQQTFSFPSVPKVAAPAFDPALGVSLPMPDGSAGSATAGSGSGSGSDTSAEPAGTVMFSDKFQLDSGRNVDFELSANVTNNWTYASLDLVNDATGAVVSFDQNLEYYSGVDSDGSWDEGSRTASQVIGPVDAGTYVLRVEAIHGGPTGDVSLSVRIRQGVFRWSWFGIFLGLLAIPFGIAALHASSFRKRRWSNSSLAIVNPPRHSPKRDDDDDDEDDE